MKINEKRELMKIFDEIASSYAYSRGRPWDIVFEILTDSPKNIVDIGCGPGHNSLLTLRKSLAEVFCVDFSMEMLKIACKRFIRNNVYQRAHLVLADIEFLPFRENSFERAIYIATIHHLPSHGSRLNSLKEVFRILKPKGKALITAWALLQPRFFKVLFKNALLKIVNPNKCLGDTYVPWRRKGRVLKRFYHLFLPHELRKLCCKVGFKILKSGGYKVKAKVFPENYYVIGLKQ